ncbi:MAG: hypothetical protein D9V47_14390 [Clostridia bacterium]|nr:MAG: hypothetical protein D9V47_14390 [Clostridia bacterium]
MEKTHIAETLLEMDANYQLKPLLAVNWQQVAPTTWELVLREGVRFHDGSSLTASEVVHYRGEEPRLLGQAGGVGQDGLPAHPRCKHQDPGP